MVVNGGIACTSFAAVMLEGLEGGRILKKCDQGHAIVLQGYFANGEKDSTALRVLFLYIVIIMTFELASWHLHSQKQELKQLLVLLRWLHLEQPCQELQLHLAYLDQSYVFV
jgi:hypothetical protein